MSGDQWQWTTAMQPLGWRSHRAMQLEEPQQPPTEHNSLAEKSKTSFWHHFPCKENVIFLGGDEMGPFLLPLFISYQWVAVHKRGPTACERGTGKPPYPTLTWEAREWRSGSDNDHPSGPLTLAFALTTNITVYDLSEHQTKKERKVWQPHSFSYRKHEGKGLAELENHCLLRKGFWTIYSFGSSCVENLLCAN